MARVRAKWHASCDEVQMKAIFQLISAVVLPILAMGFVISERSGFFDWYFGHDAVLEVAARLESSYATGVDRQVGPDEKAWTPMLRLIRKYSTSILPTDREPKILARYVAVSSGKVDIGKGDLAEWTAASTPLLLGYRNVPGPGQTAPLEDFKIVGSIGDIRAWVDRSRADLRFWVQDISLALFSIALAVIMWTKEFPAKRNAFFAWLARNIMRR